MEENEQIETGRIRTIGIAGSGIMGQGIAIVGAQHGYNVVLYDPDCNSLKSGLKKINIFLDKSVLKGKINEDARQQIVSKIKPSTESEDLMNCSLIIEAVTENFKIKYQLFQKLDKICPKNTILASNTSTIPIGKLAKATKREDRFIGMHFMNPAPLIGLVELAVAKKTSAKTIAAVKEIVQKMGKTPVIVNDSPGFVMNRILIPMINEAAYCLQEGIASKEDIDRTMKLGAGFPMGPLELADLIGIDICLHIMEELGLEFNNKKYQPCPLLKKMAKNGLLGRKSGKGFYDYSKKIQK